MSAPEGGGTPPSEARPTGPFAFRLEDIPPSALSRLPPGRHSLPDDFVEANHRSRLMAGAISSLAERGYAATTAGHIVAAAGVSNTTFYRYYAGKEDCVLAAYDLAIEWLSQEVQGAVAVAVAGGGGWPDQVRLAVARTLELFAADNRLARLCTVEVFFAGVRAEVRHRALVDRIGFALSIGRGERALGADLPRRLEPTLVGGAFALIARQLGGGEGPDLADLAPELTEYLLAPYLGAEAARAVAAGD
jgi:AcrR family transcriptional regulator